MDHRDEPHEPPETKRDKVEEELNDEEITKLYRWLEEIAKKGKWTENLYSIF